MQPRTWGVLVAVVFSLALLGISLISPSYNKCNEAHRTKAHDPDKNQPEQAVAFWDRQRERADIWAVCEGHFLHENSEVLIMLFTIVLAGATIGLWVATNNVVKSAENTAAEQLRYTRQINRAYFAGGGECERDSTGPKLNKDGHRQFRFEVGNHGRTTAFMEAYDIQFATLDEVCRRRIPFDPGTFVDQFPPGERSRPTDALIPITRSDADVAFGTVLYKDIWGTDHYARFILRIAKNGQTHSNVPGIDSLYYRKWT